MPGEDGYEILTQFKEHPFLATIPILCFSGEKSPETRKQTLEMGADGFLVKPIHPPQLLADIELLLENSNMKVESEDERRFFFLAYNTHGKEKAMRNNVNNWLNQTGFANHPSLWG